MTEGTRLETDALGRAIHDCSDCGSREGAPYCTGLDGKTRCSECTRAHDVAVGMAPRTVTNAVLAEIATDVAHILRNLPRATIEGKERAVERALRRILGREGYVLESPEARS